MWCWIVITVILLQVPLGSFICFYKTFYVPARKEPKAIEDRLPPGKIYEPYYPRMKEWLADLDTMSYEAIHITSFDGLTLRGRYYELSPDSPVEILFHGYRGWAERDMCGAVQRCFAVGHSALLVDQRAGGRSDGHVITFGAKESRDVPVWVQAVTDRFGKERKIILAGVSMGATTVMLAAGNPLPENVVGVLADCGFSTGEGIIKKVMRDMGFAPFPLYYLLWLGAKIYGGFDFEKVNCPAALAKATVPIIFFHGEDDDFVPCEMSRENYAACAAPKRLVTTPGAGHGLCYPYDEEEYITAVREFDAEYWRK